VSRIADEVAPGDPLAFSGTRLGSARLAILGGFELTYGNGPVLLPMTGQRLLAFLALQDRPVMRMYVAGSLWPDTTEDRASANLRSALWRVSRPVPALVDTSNAHLALSHHVEVDFRHSMAFANRLLGRTPSSGEDVADPAPLAKDILPDWSEDWLVMEREHFRQLRLHALESLCERLTALGRLSEAVEAGIAAVAAEPLRESAHRALIKAHLAEGNVKEAMLQYRTFRQMLDEELGLEPSESMQALVRTSASASLG
jgi:DNA-binding SARP family transcriptional activator